MKHRSFAALSLPGLSEERKAVFVPGLAILCGVFDALAIRELRLSDGALREGVLYEMEGRFRHQDIRSRTAQSTANHYNIDSEQARRVLETTDQLWQQWRDQNPRSANPQLSALLKWAAMLHEVGLTINHSGMQRHSAYILQNTNLPGFNRDQQLLLATTVRYHRKAVKTDELPRFTLFKKKQIVPLVFCCVSARCLIISAGYHSPGTADVDDRRRALDAALPGRLFQPEHAGAARSGAGANLLGRCSRLETDDRRRRGVTDAGESGRRFLRPHQPEKDNDDTSR